MLTKQCYFCREGRNYCCAYRRQIPMVMVRSVFELILWPDLVPMPKTFLNILLSSHQFARFVPVITEMRCICHHRQNVFAYAVNGHLSFLSRMSSLSLRSLSLSLSLFLSTHLVCGWYTELLSSINRCLSLIEIARWPFLVFPFYCFNVNTCLSSRATQSVISTPGHSCVSLLTTGVRQRSQTKHIYYDSCWAICLCIRGRRRPS